MRLLARLLRGSGRAVIAATIMGAIAGMATTGLVAIVHYCVSTSRFGAPPLAAFVAGCLTMLGATVASQVLLTRFAQRRALALRLELCQRIVSTSFPSIERAGAPRLLAALTEDVNALAMTLSFLPAGFTSGFVVIACLAYLGWISWKVLVVSVVCMALGIVAYKVPAARAQLALRASRETQDALYKQFRGVTDGIKELQLHDGRRSAFFTSLEATAKRYRERTEGAQSWFALCASLGTMLFFACLGLLVFGGGRSAMTTAELSGYVLTGLYMMGPLSFIVGNAHVLTRASVALRKLDDLQLALGTPGNGLPARRADPSSAAWQAIELAGVAFRYEDSESSFTLGPIDLVIRRGQVVFVVGGNGSGKSTLAKLLVGLYAPDEGHLRIGGTAVTEDTRPWYRQHFSAVFSDFYLFDDVRGLGVPDLDPTAHAYLVKFGLDKKLRITDGALSTTSLSQGQRKRLALLVACLEDRPIYLFDEWTSDQDPSFKKVFYAEVLPELKAQGKTVVVVTHDDRYFNYADVVIKMEDGRIVREPPSSSLEPRLTS